MYTITLDEIMTANPCMPKGMIEAFVGKALEGETFTDIVDQAFAAGFKVEEVDYVLTYMRLDWSLVAVLEAEAEAIQALVPAYFNQVYADTYFQTRWVEQLIKDRHTMYYGPLP